MSDARVGAGLAGAPAEVDLLVVGLGVTGAGVALDAAARGLRVLAVDAHDLAFGTSRWSSKLVHGGLRYLAHGQVGVARESALERGVLMQVTAPHLTEPMPLLLPLTGSVSRTQALAARAGLAAGDLLRRGAHTHRETLPRPRRLGATETRTLAPALRHDVRGGLLCWDGRLEDDARLVVCLARTAAHHGAVVRTRARVLSVGSGTAVLRCAITGATHRVRARAVVNAAGVWAGDLTDAVRLRPSRGSHLVLRGSAVRGLGVALTVPLGGSHSRFALVLPRPDGRVVVGLTDQPVEGPVPDVPVPSAVEVASLLAALDGVLAVPPDRADVVGSFAGLRPLLATRSGATADLSRRHAVVTDAAGVVTVVGGKLTTYRRMAQDAVDVAVDLARLDADPCCTAALPLLGAAPRATLTGILERRHGTEAATVLDAARAATGLCEADLLAPAGPGATLADLVFGVTHEGARDVADLLDRRTRIGLVPADRAAAVPIAERALRLVAGAAAR